MVFLAGTEMNYSAYRDRDERLHRITHGWRWRFAIWLSDRATGFLQRHRWQREDWRARIANGVWNYSLRLRHRLMASR